MSMVERKLKERYLNPELYSVSWDEEVATFLLFNLSGQIAGYQNYRWDGEKIRQKPKDAKYFTYVNRDMLAVFGLESFHYCTDVLFIVEGIFDAVRLHNLGLPCVAVLCNNPKPLRAWLNALGRHTVAVCDGDAAGRKLGKTCKQAIFLDEGHDLGDMTDEEVKQVVKEWL